MKPKNIYESLLNKLPNPIWMSGTDAKCYFFNHGWLDFTGRKMEQEIGDGWIDGVKAEDLEYCVDIYLKAFAKQEPFEMEYRLMHKSGEYRWIRDYGNPCYDMEGKFSGYIGSCYDIHEAKKSRERIEELTYEYETVFQGTQDALFLLDIDEEKKFRYRQLNRAYEKMSGLTTEQIRGRTPEEVFSKELAEQLTTDFTQCMELKSSLALEETLAFPAGERIWHTVLTPIMKDGTVIHIVGSRQDVTEEKRNHKLIEYLGQHDPLTALYNRLFFVDAMKRVNEKQYYPVSVIMGDVNGLKLTNDAFGHTVGDELLCKVAKVFKSACRKQDIVARIGGDEFVILLPNTNATQTQSIMQRIDDLCELEKAEPIKPSISLGYSVKIDGTEPLNNIYKQAEDKMYESKLLKAKENLSVIIECLKKNLYEKTHETKAHCERVEQLSVSIGKAMGFTQNELHYLSMAALLHDIGKSAVDLHVLEKKDELTSDEWTMIKKHSEIGYRITNTVPELAGIAVDILSHHERWDGKGYPMGLIGEDIPLKARIIAVADTYDAMTHDRSYRKAFTQKQALEQLHTCKGKQYDPRIVDILNELL